MTAAHRNLARLPLEIFENLILYHDDEYDEDEKEQEREWKDPAILREAICQKLMMTTMMQQQQRSSSSSVNDAVANPTNEASTTTTTNTPIVAVATVGGFLKTSSCTLLQVLDPLLTYEQCEELRYRICRHCAAVPYSALSLLYKIHVPTTTNLNSATAGSFLSRDDNPHVPTMILSTGIPTLDQHLQGGIRVGTITELVGRAGVGKSQLALQLCVRAALQYGLGSVYIDTEHKLQLSRLQQIAQQQQQQQSQQSLRNDQTRVQHVMANVTVHTPTTTDDLLSTVARLEEEILFRNAHAQNEPSTTQRAFPVGLVVIDSIAAPTKRDLGGSDHSTAPQRAAAMLQCAQMLKRLACQLDLAVVVINQASVAFQPTTTTTATNSSTSHNTSLPPPSVVAALGTAWHHCVSTRLLLDFTTTAYEDHDVAMQPGDDNESARGPAISARTLSVVKSNMVGYSQINYQVTDCGIVEMPM